MGNCTKWKRGTAILVMMALIVVTVPLMASHRQRVSAQEGGEITTEDIYGGSGSNAERYVEYRERYSSERFTGEAIVVNALSYIRGEDITEEKDYEGRSAVIAGEGGTVSWEFAVRESGLFTVKLDYFPVSGYGSNIERNLKIDGKFPFREAEGIEFTRIYADEEADPSGSLVRPNQVEKPEWTEAYAADSFGYFGQALLFYLEEGLHTLELEAVREPVAISQITLESVDRTPSGYGEVLAQRRSEGAKEVKGAVDGGVIVIQAENSYRKGDPTLYASSDSSSTRNQPFDYRNKLINVIGGSAYKFSNQWISWKLTVPEDGFYTIGARYKQNFVRDIDCSRTLLIDGSVPFSEAESIHFTYGDEWNTVCFGGEEPYLFYLTAGEHTLTLQVTAGDLTEVLTEADYILENLNAINLDLLALLSINPDVDRDYQIGRYMPDTVEALNENAERVRNLYEELVSRTGKTDSLTSQLEQLIKLLENMGKTPERIASLYSRYRDLVGSFGSWIMTVREQPILLDYLFAAEPGTVPDTREDGFFQKLYAGFVSFLYSFVTDYSMLSQDEAGEDSGEKEPITVWIGSGLTGGRDQAMALNQIVSQYFTPKTGIPVNLQLVPENTILMATLAGRGPDVALQVKMTDPVDFALRNAVYDLTRFSDYEEVSERFFDSAAEPFTYAGGVYALPETLSFPMLFYRTDILNDLGIEPSKLQTWKNIVEILPVLQGQNMNFALPATMPTYSMFLYQMGGSYYTEDGTASNLNSKTALDAFEYWTDFYSVYSLTVDFSFENRFRTGEMPIGIAEYTTYNLLSISAPEIKGKWAMTQVPGVVAGDGSIVNISPATSQGCILMNTSDHKEEAWEFMKWWTGADIQYEFGKQLEAVMGAAARYNTANREALARMPWTAADRQALMLQADNLQGIPQIPGGYFTERNLNFAKLAVINKKENPRETLAAYSEAITEEITLKRQEFGLD